MQQVEHVANGVVFGIHDVFPAVPDVGKDPISELKLAKGEGQFARNKCIRVVASDRRLKVASRPRVAID